MDNSRILIILGSYPEVRCGVADYVKEVVEELLSRNIDVCLLTSCDPRIKKEKYINPLIKKWDIIALFKILLFVKRNQPKLINLQIPTIKYRATFSSIGFFPLLSKLFFKDIPTVVTVHDFAISRPYFKIFFLPLLLFSDKILVTNKSDEEDIRKYFPFLRNKIRKIYMGPTVRIVKISDKRRKELLKKIHYTGEERFITTLGFIKPDRHLEIIIKVFSKLRERDKKLKLLIIGDIQREDDKKYLNNLIELCNRLDLQNEIFWIGFGNSEEVSCYLAESSISILLYERGASLRRSTLINCALRKSPIVTNINEKYGVDQDLLNIKIALTVDSLDIDKLLKKSELILYDINLAEEMKKKTESTMEMFNWKNTTDKISNLFQEIIEKKTVKCEKKYY